MGDGLHNNQHIINDVLRDIIKEVKSDPGVFPKWRASARRVWY